MNCPSCNIQEGDYTKGCNACDDRVRAAYADFAALDEAANDPDALSWVDHDTNGNPLPRGCQRAVLTQEQRDSLTVGFDHGIPGPDDPREAPWNYRNVLIALVVIGCIYGFLILGSKHIWAWATGLHT